MQLRATQQRLAESMSYTDARCAGQARNALTGARSRGLRANRAWRKTGASRAGAAEFLTRYKFNVYTIIWLNTESGCRAQGQCSEDAAGRPLLRFAEKQVSRVAGRGGCTSRVRDRIARRDIGRGEGRARDPGGLGPTFLASVPRAIINALPCWNDFKLLRPWL